MFGEFFLRLNREDQVPMLAVEISRCALVSHRGADSRHDSPTEFGGMGGELGANWAADKHEQLKVLRWILFTSLPVSV